MSGLDTFPPHNALRADAHGAQFQKVRWNPGARVLELLLLAGNHETGFFDLLVRYHNARIAPAAAQFQQRVEDPHTRVQSLEIEREGDLALHRWRLEPDGAVEVVFSDLHQGRLERTTADFQIPAERFEIVSC